MAFDRAGNQYQVRVDNALVQRVGKDCVVTAALGCPAARSAADWEVLLARPDEGVRAYARSWVRL